MNGMPQPGEWWRVRIRPVEFQCPHCLIWIEVSGRAHDGVLARIVPKPSLPFIHRRRGCNRRFAVPEGWVYFTTTEADGDPTIYTLPYTLFEPVASSG